MHVRYVCVLLGVVTTMNYAMEDDELAWRRAVIVDNVTQLHKLSDVNVQDSLDQTPVHIATLYNSMASLQYLLERKASCDVVDIAGDTPFHIAVRQRHKDALFVLLASSAQHRNFEFVKTCLNTKNAEGHSVRDVAQAQHSVSFMEYLDTILQQPEFEPHTPFPNITFQIQPIVDIYAL